MLSLYPTDSPIITRLRLFSSLAVSSHGELNDRHFIGELFKCIFVKKCI